MLNQKTTEVVIFKLKDGVSVDDFVKLATAMTPDLKSFSGFQHRELGQDANGYWIDIVHWSRLEDALQAAQKIMDIPNSHAFMGMIDESSISMYHTQSNLVL
jgi:hypothetical protein